MQVFDLKTFRLSKTKHTQEELAKILKVSKGAIGKIEAGHANPSDKLLGKIEEAFKLDLTKHKSWYTKSIANDLKDDHAIGLVDIPRKKERLISTSEDKLLSMLEQQSKDLEDCRKENERLLKEMLKMQKEHQKDIIKTKAKQ